MGKEYITDTVSLRGVETIDEKTQMRYLLSQVTANTESSNKADISAFSVSNVSDFRMSKSRGTTTISIGGLVDESSPIQPIFFQTANTIRFYTGQVPDFNLVLFYPGTERFTIDKRGYVGINNPNIDTDRVTFDVRSTTAMAANPEFVPRVETPSIAITHPYYKYKGGEPPTPQYIGRLQFRSVQSPDEATEDAPTDMAAIQVETDGQSDVYGDARVNMTFNTNTGGREGRPELVKHLEINGFENKTKIFTKLNLGKVPVFRDLKEAISGGLVSGDVWQDRDANLKIIFGEQEDEEFRSK